MSDYKVTTKTIDLGQILDVLMGYQLNIERHPSDFKEETKVWITKAPE